MYQISFLPGGECTLWDFLHENKQLQAVSNGSLDQDAALASHGWLLIGNGNVLVQRAGPVDGVPDFISSTWAELFGIGAIMELLHHFCNFHGIQSTSCIIKCCNNRAAISRVNKTLQKHVHQH
jgi:hypothetical protein